MSTPTKDRTKNAPTPKRAAANRRVSAEANEPEPTTAAVRSTLGAGSRRALPWALAGVAATAHAFTIPVAAHYSGDPIVTMLWVMVPAWVTIALLPVARRTGYHRWLAVLVLANIVDPFWSVPTLIVAHTWVLHQFWSVEHEGPTLMGSMPGFWRPKARKAT